VRKTTDPTHKHKRRHGASIFTHAGEARSGEAAHKHMHTNKEVSLGKGAAYQYSHPLRPLQALDALQAPAPPVLLKAQIRSRSFNAPMCFMLNDNLTTVLLPN
jgi:hypothetical protein